MLAHSSGKTNESYANSTAVEYKYFCLRHYGRMRQSISFRNPKCQGRTLALRFVILSVSEESVPFLSLCEHLDSFPYRKGIESVAISR